MKREDISEEQYVRILECFMRALMKHGFKATTMDQIAASLQMSKRTLYEIFGNKEELFKEAHMYFHKKMSQKLEDIFRSSSNVMEAIIKCFLFNRDLMSRINADFIRDMEELASQTNIIDSNRFRKHHINLYEVLQKGVDEGYFRQDINLMVQCRMLTIQMEALKRSEELFSKDIPLLEVYDSIILGFLRGISTEKGLIELEKYTPLTSFNC